MQAVQHNTLAVQQWQLKRQLLETPKILVMLRQRLLAKLMLLQPKNH